MSVRRTWAVRIATSVLVVLAILVAVPVVCVIRERHRSEYRLVHLLSETDYQALLSACRELSRRAAAGDLKVTVYHVRRSLPWIGRYRPDPEVGSFPRAILDVDPVFVRVEGDGRVWVALFPTPSQGVMAYPEDYKLGRDSFGDKELVQGLWFCDEQYREDTHPEYVKYVDELIDRGKRHQGIMTEGKPGSHLKY